VPHTFLFISSVLCTLISLGLNSQLTEFVLVMNWKEICQNDCPVYGTRVMDAISLCLGDKEKIT
jgi:hypothetical protein